MVVKYKYFISVSENAQNSESELKSEFTRILNSKEELDDFEERIKNFILALSSVCPEYKFDKQIIFEDIDV